MIDDKMIRLNTKDKKLFWNCNRPFETAYQYAPLITKVMQVI